MPLTLMDPGKVALGLIIAALEAKNGHMVMPRESGSHGYLPEM